MLQIKFIKDANHVFYRLKFPLVLLALSISSVLPGCASFNSKEESIEAILAKENALIEKIQVERALPQVQQEVLQCQSLKQSESHLSQALQELLKANDVVTMKLLNQSRGEVLNERY